MKGKIQKNLIFLSSLAILLSLGLFIFSFYGFYSAKEKQHLRNYGNILANLVEQGRVNDAEEAINDIGPRIRMSIIESNGDIIFDSIKNYEEMENHLDRREVEEALEKGSGESIRYSSTLQRDTYYYAILLSNKEILRISIETNNILAVFLTILPAIIILAIFLILLSLWLSRLLTKKILAPIEELTDNMENLIRDGGLPSVDPYDELLPFLRALGEQANEIKIHIKDIVEKSNIIDSITSNMQEGLILLDGDSHIISLNKSSIALLNGNPSYNYESKAFINLCRDLELSRKIQESISQSSPNNYVLKYRDSYISIFINPVLDNRKLQGLILFLLDSTKEYKNEQIRKEFSANVSHELKTPLTSINGYAEIIESGMAGKDDTIRFATIIRKEGSRLLNLIDSIIKLSKIEEEAISEEMDYINLNELGEEVVSRLSPLMDNKEIKLNLRLEDSFIYGNRTMINELIYNLLDNAIKYSEDKSVIDLDICGQNPATIRIRDYGIGISPQDQERIFERFFVVDKSRNKKTSSFGLGLSIVKHIVDYHGASIQLNSGLGKGTEIIVRI